MFNASLSGYRALKTRAEVEHCDDDENVLSTNKMDLFSRRGSLKLPRTIQKSDLQHLSFYAFWRQFYFKSKTLHKRTKEQFISVSGTGFPAQANREHAQHAFYARQTLYAYAPCPKLLGLEYIDVMVKHEYKGSWPAALRAFVQDPLNKWCPPWIRTNYEILNEDSSDDEMEKNKSEDNDKAAATTVYDLVL